MRKMFLLLIVVAFNQLLLAQAPTSQPAKPAAQADQPQTVNGILDRTVTRLEKQFVDLADAMPEDKYNFVPTNGEFKDVRSFGSQVKHVAGGNYDYFAIMLGEKPPVADTENGPDTAKSKADIMKLLRDSFAYAHKAIGAVNDKNLVEPVKAGGSGRTTTRLALAMSAVAHIEDHYGQLVEYLRMNNIIPPASRR